MSLGRVFPRSFTHGRGDKTLMGGLMRGDIDLMGGPRPYGGTLYHKLKVLLLLSCNYTMQLVG